ncbi:MAG: hypothetical protein QOH31_1863 [Verrucomicrobiota bacterium]
MRTSLLSTSIKSPAVAAIALVLVSSASICLAGTERQPKNPTPVSHQWNYFHDKVGNTDTQIQWAPVGKPPGFTEP